LAYDKGLEKVESTYQNDFNEILSIEPFSFYADQETDENTKPIGQADFERAEEKAVKAIQKHSMLIRGEEKNNQIDETYLLLAKSRYYTKRFGPALEALEYIIKHYQGASLIFQTVVWRAKANIHLSNVDFGKKSLKKLLESPDLSPKTRQEAEIGMVMAYEKTPDSLDQIIEHLEASLVAVDKGNIASRAAFVLGQIYKKQEKIKESDLAFDKVIDTKRGVYRLEVQAKLEKINNHIEEYSTEEFLDEVDHLIRVTKNRNYIGALLYEKGLIYEASDSIMLAQQLFSESVQRSKNDLRQTILSYEKLGDISYDLKKYSYAKLYYDSLIDVSKNKNSKRTIRIQRKSNSLDKIVRTQEDAMANDSLLKIANMTDADLTIFFEKHIERIKEQEKRLLLKELKLLAEQNKVSFDAKVDWYFYNNQQRIRGKKDFKKTWKLSSRRTNWYASSIGGNGIVNKDDVEIVKEKQLKDESKYDVSYYTSQVNRDPEFLKRVTKDRNLDYYELGNAYYHQLSEKELAIDKLNELILFDPSDDLRIGAYYRLYKIYSESGDLEKASLYSQKLQKEFPNSAFTRLMDDKNNEEDESLDVNSYVSDYEAIYKLYTDHLIEDANIEMKIALGKYADTPLAPKYALLNAYIIARLEGKEAFETELKNIELRYPNTIEGLKAGELLGKK